MKKIKLGIYEELTLQFGTRSIGCVLPINAHEMISTTTREIRLFENEEIKECISFSFSCACFVPEVGLIVAHSSSKDEITVMKSNDISHPILTKFKTGHTYVYHMIYSSKSKSIITIGSGIKVFTISWVVKGSHFFSSNYEVTLKFRSEFADDYEPSLLNPPSFDEEGERLFLPTPEGICAFDLDGEFLSFASKLPADGNTSYAFCQNIGKLLTFDPTDGLCLWKKDGCIDKRINITSLIIIGLRFIDAENVVCLSSTYSIHLLNIKTGDIFECYKSPPHVQLTRFFSANLHYNPYVFLCYGNKMKFLRINAPWNTFSLNIIRPRSIHRCNKFQEAARICILTDNFFVKLFNPKKSCLVTSATPSEPIYPSSIFYDRGIFTHFQRDNLYPKYLTNIIQTDPETPRDFLYIVYDNGQICKFDATKSPSEEIWLKSLNAHLMTMIYYKNSWCYAISHIHGMLSFNDLDTFSKIKEISISRKPFKYMFYNYSLNCLIFLTNKSVKIFDLHTELYKFKLKIESPNTAYLFGEILYFGYQDGRINRYKITKWALSFIEPEIMSNPHNDSVTSIDFSPNYYISASFDQTCIIWNYFHSRIIQLTLPFPIYSIAFHGVKRDLLIGTKSCVMFLKGSLLFGDENWDPELIGYDSYDLLDDKLDPRLIAEKSIEKKKEKAIEEAETSKKIEKSIMNSIRKNNFKRAYEEYKRNQELLIEKFNNENGINGAAKTPESRQRTVDQMLQLLDLATDPESQAKLNAIKNAKLFIEEKKSEKLINESQNSEGKISKESEKSEKSEELQNSVKPIKYVSGADFIKNQIEIENKRKKRKNKRKKVQTNKIETKNDDTKIANNQLNLLEKLSSKGPNLNDLKSKNKKSNIQIDISKMNFVQCTTENKEIKEEKYEYYESDDSISSESKKKKKKKVKLPSKSSSKSSSKFNTPAKSQKPIQIKLNDKTTANSMIIPKGKKDKSKNKIKNANSHENIKTAKSSKKLNKSRSQQVEDFNGNLTEFLNENSKLINSSFIDKNGVTQQLLNYEFINDDGEIVELPDGQFVNDKGQVVNENGQLIDQNGEIITGDSPYRYRGSDGKIRLYSAPSDEEKRTREIDEFADCVFIDDFGKISNKQNVYLNEYGQYVDAFGDRLTKLKTSINSEGQKLSQNGFIISEDGQLIDQQGQKVDINGKLLPKVLYSDAGCQSEDSSFLKPSIHSKIHKLKSFLNPKDRRYRPSTPPPIRWNNEHKGEQNDHYQLPASTFLLNKMDSKSRTTRSRTPPQLRSKTMKKASFTMPQPNYVLDSEVILSIYGRGQTEFLPLVFRLVREGVVPPSKVPIPSSATETEVEFDSSEQKQTVESNPSGDHFAKDTSERHKEPKERISFSDINNINPSEIKASSGQSSSSQIKKSNDSVIDVSTQIESLSKNQPKSKSDKKNSSSLINNNEKAIKKNFAETNEEGIEKNYVEMNEEEELIEEEEFYNQSEEHQRVTFDIPRQEAEFDDPKTNEKSNIPTPPRQSYNDHEIFRRDHKNAHQISPKRPNLQPPSTVNQKGDPIRRSPRRNNFQTFPFTSCETLDDNESDFKPKRKLKSAIKKGKEESLMIKQKRINQKNGESSTGIQILGEPFYMQGKKCTCFPPRRHADDCPPVALNQKGKKFAPPEEFSNDDFEHQLHNSENSDDEDFVAENRSKIVPTRSTRTTPNSSSMARLFKSVDKGSFRASKSIVDYSYLLEPGAVEEPHVADDIMKNYEDKEDVFFSLRSMFPKTNQMAMMIQTPASIQNTKYSKSLQEYSNEFSHCSPNKGIIVKKKENKNSNNSSLKKKKMQKL